MCIRATATSVRVATDDRVVMRSVTFAIIVMGAVLVAAGTARSEGAPVWQPLAENIVRIIDEAETHYKAGEAEAAQRSVVEAYFGVFEDRKMEAAMRITIGAKHTRAVEKQFADLRNAIKNGEGASVVHEIAEAIRHAVRRDARILDDAGIPAEVFKVNQ